MRKQVLITIDDFIYDVTKFIASHPGEGIHDMYLRNYHLKNGSSEFEQFHNSDEAHTWIETAQLVHIVVIAASLDGNAGRMIPSDINRLTYIA